jgi:low temperature requirement protein LtrA
MVNGRRPLLRAGGGHQQSRVTFVELFFDLVFVFAVTQLSHGFLEHLTPLGALQTALLMGAVWCVWIYTSWVTNWLDPDRIPVRLMMFALMFGGLVFSASIPQAFGDRGWAFGACYAAMHVGRTLFMLWAAHHDVGLRRNFLRIGAWLSVSGVLWLVGGAAAPEARLGLWAAALLLDYGGPWAGFWAPGLGRSTTADWNVSGAHMAERCGLFVIIALGESVLVTGATFSDATWTREIAAAFAIALLGSVAMWWIYFNATAGLGSRIIADSADPGRLARSAYTYLHIPIVAGIVVSAVGDELLLAHPSGHADANALLTIAGGAALYLAGILLFRWSVFRRISVPKMLGLAGLAALAPVHTALSPLVLASAVVLILTAIGAWETVELAQPRTGP